MADENPHKTEISQKIIYVISLLITIGLAIYCSLSIVSGFWFSVCEGGWGSGLFSFANFLISILLLPVFAVGAFYFGKFEKQLTDGRLNSGTKYMISIIVFLFGTFLFGIGIIPIAVEASGFPPMSSCQFFYIPALIIGLLILIPTFIINIRESSKRRNRIW